MRKLFALLFLYTGLAYSQTELPQYSTIIAQLASLYNAQDYQGIYELYDVNMQKALTPAENQQFFSENVNRIMGDINEWEFIGFQRGAHVYRTSFERALSNIMISLSGQNNKINGFYIAPPKPLGIPVLERNTTKMILPFREEVFVYWGGTTLEQNYHLAEISQQYAYDLLMVKDGRSYQGDPKINENYFVFGKEIIAPCDARVVLVIDGVPDNEPGTMNPAQLTGNTIVLQTDLNEYILFAHLQEGSLEVEEGEEVRQGNVIARCGNSGNTTEPHLHLSLQNTINMEEATGGKLYFDQIMVNGEIKTDYLPVKEDFIRNLN
ncbi:MAG: peptidoglycan DD-metalloendopeptidase family protein [Muriicola sp.]|nr:peptidoglycan DD-metalloendopeptidase family protein [Muriicola sp.]NNC61913.1 peptidoglycan DD-metalloendopeptidase family protein [Eudoraea sp.]NNK20218.1 peptidoglycan DD-metalloendopeptidase family protein [Flavobacteriaceae bacterium]NNK34565.1 peptidoglycan DD-metalloendopeptidase family protein [Eudoraea sp.]